VLSLLTFSGSIVASKEMCLGHISLKNQKELNYILHTCSSILQLSTIIIIEMQKNNKCKLNLSV